MGRILPCHATKGILVTTTLFFSGALQAFVVSNFRADLNKTPILADAAMIQASGAKVLAQDAQTGVGFSRMNQDELTRLRALSHAQGGCAGFEQLPEGVHPDSYSLKNIFADLSKQEEKNRQFQAWQRSSLTENPAITAAVAQISTERVREGVDFLSKFPTRYNKGEKANEPVEAFKKKVESILSASNLPYKVDLISHQSTPQKSLRVHFEGYERPAEIIVLGGHIDSINGGNLFPDPDGEAPGADDNASGSSDLLEAMRVFSQQARPQRSIEFIWYAGEEEGLLGSAEIAKDYKERNVTVIGVLQLDMTSVSGDGEFALGSMTDFTSAWMRSYFADLNNIYIKAKIIESKCGYGCSDHASWFQKGYPTLMPHESSFQNSNKKLHTPQDRIDVDTNFKHAAMFAKIALAIAMDLGNSTAHEP